MDVAGARRRVEDEEVEFAPVCIGDELLEGTRGHTASPKRGSCGGNEEADGKQFDAVFLDGTDEVATVFLDGIGAFIFDIEHLGHRRAEYIGVEQSYAIAETGEGDGEIGRDGALAYATLAGADGDDVLDTREQFLDLRARSGLKLGDDVDVYLVAPIWISRSELFAVILNRCLCSLDGRFEEGISVAGKFQYDLDLPGLSLRGGSGDRRGVGHHTALHEVFLRAGIRHRCQSIDNQLRI